MYPINTTSPATALKIIADVEEVLVSACLYLGLPDAVTVIRRNAIDG